jgi:hypothetical protein
MKINEVTLNEQFPRELTPGSEQRNGYTSFLGSDGYNYFVSNEPDEQGNLYYYQSVVRGGNRMRLKAYPVPPAQQDSVRAALSQSATPDMTARGNASDAEAAGLPDWAAGYSNFGAALGQYAQQNDGELPPSLTTSPSSMATATRDMEAAGITVQPDSPTQPAAPAAEIPSNGRNPNPNPNLRTPNTGAPAAPSAQAADAAPAVDTTSAAAPAAAPANSTGSRANNSANKTGTRTQRRKLWRYH